MLTVIARFSAALDQAPHPEVEQFNKRRLARLSATSSHPSCGAFSKKMNQEKNTNQENCFAMDHWFMGWFINRFDKEITWNVRCIFPCIHGSANDVIHCFKEGDVLRSQLSILNEPDTNPFEVSDSDVEDASIYG